MANLNRILIVGRLIADPEARVSVEGVPVTKFKLAVTNFGRQATGQIEVITWRRLAEICGQYLKKDRLVLAEGRLQVRSYEDQGGQRKWVTEVAANNVQMLEGSGPVQAAAPGEAEPAEGEEVEELPEGDLPF